MTRDPRFRGDRLCRPGGHSEGPNTRSHPELGRENPQRRWYCTSRCGRVGRRQARIPLSPNLPSRSATDRCNPIDAGWSSPVARQAHNLKVVGSNPTPATIFIRCASRVAERLPGVLVSAAAPRCPRVHRAARCRPTACRWACRSWASPARMPGGSELPRQSAICSRPRDSFLPAPTPCQVRVHLAPLVIQPRRPGLRSRAIAGARPGCR